MFFIAALVGVVAHCNRSHSEMQHAKPISLTKNNELIASLKRHKRANKSVQTALPSLRQLQSLKA